MTEPLRMAVVSDIHLGNRRNTAAEIVKNLYAAFPDNAETGQLDLIVIAGDLTDDLLSLPHDDVVDIDLWIAYMIGLCARRKIVLRVLKGTPSHDWDQPRRFVDIENILKTGVDLRYVRDLSIEYIEPLRITALYVPDEWNTDNNKTYEEVLALMRAKGLDKVDYAFMHGQFEYQIPMAHKAPTHNAQNYLAIVRHLIFIGHVHTASSFERIYAQGSFDRIAHGEENPKGHLRAIAWPNGEHEVTFVETVNAKRFVTIGCVGLDLDETLAKIDRQASNFPDGSYVRIEADDDNPIFTNMETLIRRFPTYVWSKKAVTSDEKTDPEHYVQEETLYVPITLTKDNIGDLLMGKLSTLGLPVTVLDAAVEILQEVTDVR
ncbi:3',5'-cyclic adenosine monophosphate phosphodiesterase CpdA [compost metagenome]